MKSLRDLATGWRLRDFGENLGSNLNSNNAKFRKLHADTLSDKRKYFDLSIRQYQEIIDYFYFESEKKIYISNYVK